MYVCDWIPLLKSLQFYECHSSISFVYLRSIPLIGHYSRRESRALVIARHLQVKIESHHRLASLSTNYRQGRGEKWAVDFAVSVAIILPESYVQCFLMSFSGDFGAAMQASSVSREISSYFPLCYDQRSCSRERSVSRSGLHSSTYHTIILPRFESEGGYGTVYFGII